MALVGKPARASRAAQTNFLSWVFTEETTLAIEQKECGCASMQGRAGKALKREMVIESPQQYKALAEIEAEAEAASQVPAVSDRSVVYRMCNGFNILTEERK